MPGEIKFSQLPSGSAIQDADIFPSVQSGDNVKQSASAILAYIENTIDPTITLQNAYDTGNGTIQGNLNTKPIQFKNSGGTPLLDSSESAVDIIGSASENLLIANNLSDVNDVSESRGNIGLPTQIFVANQDINYAIGNPCPGIFYINMPTAGHIMKLPPLGVAGSLDPSTTIEFSASLTSQDLLIQDSDGNNILTISAGQKYIAVPAGVTLAPPTGWVFTSAPDGGSQDMQSTYNYGSIVNLRDSQPIKFATGSGYGDPENLTTFYSPSLASAPPVSYVIGMAFTMNQNGVISSLGYTDTVFSSGTREVGLWSYTTSTTGTLLATANVAKSDPLDAQTGKWRMHAITPVAVTAGTRYVVAELNPTTDQWLFYAWNPPSFCIVDGQSQVNYASATLVYPPINDVLSTGPQWGNANFQFQPGSAGTESLLFNDTVSNTNTLFELNSTTRGSKPYPQMTTVQRDAISSPDAGVSIYNTDTNTIDYYDGTAWQIGLTVDHLEAGDNITLVDNGDGTVTINASGSSPSGNSDYAGWCFVGSALSTTFGLSDTYYPITVDSPTFSDLVSSNFVNEIVTITSHPTPVFRYIDNATQFFDVNFNINVRGATAFQQQYIFQIFIQRANTSIIFTGYKATITLQDLIFPYDISLSGIVQLNTGDRVGVCVQSVTTANSLVVVYGNATITNMDASANAAMTWTDVTGTSQSMSPQNGYVPDNAGLVTLTLPTIANFGSEIRVVGKGSGGWTVSQNSGQNIVVGSSASTVGVGGSISSTNAHDCMILTCTTANTQWTAYGVQGSLTIV